jgi:F-type H+-transporting ATPase subunit b
MQIDWFTVIAQVVNFLLLVWLLKRFLYGPILKAIDQREERVTQQLKNAEAEMAEAERLQHEYIGKNQAFDQERDQKMEQARSEAEAMKMELLQKAREEAEALAKRLQAAAQFQHAQARNKAVKQVGEEVMTIVEQILQDLADATLEHGTLNVFIKHLNSLEYTERTELQKALVGNDPKLVVSTSFELTKAQRKTLSDAIDRVIGNRAEITFGVKPELVAGVELVANGYRLGWSIAEYLDSLGKKLADLNEEEAPAKTKTDEQ